MKEKEQKTEAVVPEPDMAAEPAAEPETPTSHEGKRVSDLEVGDTFYLEEKKYQLYQMFGETAQVMLLNTVKNQVAPNKYVDQEVGVEFIEMPEDTVIE